MHIPTIVYDILSNWVWLDFGGIRSPWICQIPQILASKRRGSPQGTVERS